MELPKIVAGLRGWTFWVSVHQCCVSCPCYCTVVPLMSDGTPAQQSKGLKRMRSECEDERQQDTNGKEQSQVVAGEGGGIDRRSKPHIPRAYRRAQI